MTVDRAYCLACCVPVASCECRPGDAIAGLEVTELKVETIELAVPPDVDAERSQFRLSGLVCRK
jgi:hypothetical protein